MVFPVSHKQNFPLLVSFASIYASAAAAVLYSCMYVYMTDSPSCSIGMQPQANNHISARTGCDKSNIILTPAATPLDPSGVVLCDLERCTIVLVA